jgi:hypothetical protein
MLLSNADLVIWEAIAKSRGVYVKQFACGLGTRKPGVNRRPGLSGEE